MSKYTCESCGRSFYNTSTRVQTKCGRCQRTRKMGEFWWMCVICWHEWPQAQPHIAPECSCRLMTCRHFWRHSCYHDSYLERQWTDNRQGKPRRIVLIRSVWHLSRDSELAYQIHTIWHGQRSVAYAAARYRSRVHPEETGAGTTQEGLSFLDWRPPVPEADFVPTG